MHLPRFASVPTCHGIITTFFVKENHLTFPPKKTPTAKQQIQTASLERHFGSLASLTFYPRVQKHFLWGFTSYFMSKSQRGAPPTCTFESNWTIKSNWSLQHRFSTLKNSDDTPLDSIRSFEQKFAELRSIGNCVNECDLSLLLKNKTAPICYVWCDPSPWMHITQGILMTINVNKMIKAGFKVKILMADWFAQMDRKICFIAGGDLSKVHTIGLYNVETWKATGMDLDGVEFVWLSDLVSKNADEYWPLAMDIARKSNLSAIKNWLRVYASINTRGHGHKNPYSRRDFTAAEIFYPCLQSACILFQKQTDIWLLGLDQSGAHMLAREYCNHNEMENRPIALFNNMPSNLLESPQLCAIDDPNWAIFMEDDEEGIISKISDAFCPPESAEGNPCLDYIKYIVLPWFGKFEVVLNGDNGGSKTFVNMEEFTFDYESGVLHPSDVKQALAKAINMMLQPVRDHFRSSAEAQRLVKANEDFYSSHW
ncbi:tyrosine--tRNA ligase 1, cytoplasmic-like [Lolium rigidum]|uniref:tyrosine--tRNA ligase 1, cytoplasmic-like n=1 Tax=Lolium rigidum TaxID=89674 RepID=UPI001F5E0DD8|nr:tyrosine--tRNA ligase 1, cytoplasmic-like [Lolium rigidum]